MLYLPLLVTSSRFCRPVEGVIHQFPFVAPRFFFLKTSQPRCMTTFQPSRKDTFFNRVAQPTGFHASAINWYLHWTPMEGFNDVSSQTSFKKNYSMNQQHHHNLGRCAPSKLAGSCPPSLMFVGTFLPRKIHFFMAKGGELSKGIYFILLVKYLKISTISYKWQVYKDVFASFKK